MDKDKDRETLKQMFCAICLFMAVGLVCLSAIFAFGVVLLVKADTIIEQTVRRSDQPPRV